MWGRGEREGKGSRRGCGRGKETEIETVRISSDWRKGATRRDGWRDEGMMKQSIANRMIQENENKNKRDRRDIHKARQLPFRQLGLYL